MPNMLFNKLDVTVGWLIGRLTSPFSTKIGYNQGQGNSRYLSLFWRVNDLNAISYTMWMKQVKMLLLLLMMMMMMMTTTIKCNTRQTLELPQCMWWLFKFNEELVQVIIRQLVSFLSPAQTLHTLLTALLSTCI